MPIKVLRADGNLYTAEISPPHGRGRVWATGQPVTGSELIRLLLERGCHQTDIGDAFSAADPDWLLHPDG